MPEKGLTLLIVLLVVLVLFGAKRLPDAARSLGRSMRIFKAETKGLLSDDEAAAPAQGSQAAPVARNLEIPPGAPTAAPPAAQPVHDQQHDAR